MAIQSITVPAGTPIYIPKNATILMLTETGDALAESDCYDLNTIPPSNCYGIVMGAARNSDTPTTVFRDYAIKEVIIDNVVYPTNSNFRIQQNVQLTNEMIPLITNIFNANPVLRNFTSDLCVTFTNLLGHPNRGNIHMIIVSLPDTVGQSLQFKLEYTGDISSHIGQIHEPINLYTKAKLMSQIISEANQSTINLCGCAETGA